MDDKEAVVAAQLEQPKRSRKPRRPAAKKEKPPTPGRKTLYAASGALAFAAADFLLSLRYPDLPGACQVLRNMF